MSSKQCHSNKAKMLVWATCARHVLASMLNNDIRSSVEPTIAFTPII